MISLDPADLSERDSYKLLIGSIIPRPIAFVTTLSKSGVLNAAPYSYFNIVTANPPMISISAQRRNGERKDTARNAIENGQFVVHISDESNIAKINETAASVPSCGRKSRFVSPSKRDDWQFGARLLFGSDGRAIRLEKRFNARPTLFFRPTAKFPIRCSSAPPSTICGSRCGMNRRKTKSYLMRSNCSITDFLRERS